MTTLRLERSLGAPPARVFAAFLDPASVAEWFGPAGFTAVVVQLDARVCGRYRFEMHPPDGAPFHLGGAFREIDPPRHLVFSFAYEEPDPDDRETTVTLALEPDGDGTRLVLEQTPFVAEARRELHRAGWTDTLDRLAAVLG
jgi:uncharacterized protein YndB with AHSA1/START domain